MPFAIIPGLDHTPDVNFLAHLYLARPTPPSMIGNLLPDMVPGPLSPRLDPQVLAGAKNHMRVDAFTDTHPVFARTRARLRDRHGRFSAILTDLFYDHALSCNWGRYHDQPLADFIGQAHKVFAGYSHLMPDPMPAITRRFIEQDWLSAYATYDGMAEILARMSDRFSQRLKQPVKLEHAVEDLKAHRDALADDFAEFFPQLIGYVMDDHPEAVEALADSGEQKHQTGPEADRSMAGDTVSRCGTLGAKHTTRRIPE